MRVIAALTLVGIIVAGCSSASSGQPATSRSAPSETVRADQAPPSLKSTCYSTGGVRTRSMWLRTSDGVRLYAVEAGTGGTAVVLAEEGRTDLCGWLPYVRTLTAAGIRVLAFDFRGQGESSYPPSVGPALGRDLEAAATRAREDGAQHLVLVGASMGGAAVVQNSVDIPADGRISLSGTVLWPGYGVNDPSGVRRLRGPFLYIGSRADTLAPLAQARSIYRAVGSSRKRMILYPGTAHGWDLIGDTPRGARTRALILRWIRSHS